MRVKELLEKLNSFPQDLEVKFVYDSAARGNIFRVYRSRSNEVILISEYETVYSDEDRESNDPIN